MHMAFTGLGPVYLNPTEGFIQMSTTWCNNASMLFIDTPSGTGYSYAERNLDYFGNDVHQARDALKFMQMFYKDYPEYITNHLYISGVSYGGIYAPMLAWKIHGYNQEQELLPESDRKKFPLRGIMVQNGVADYNHDPSTHTIDQLAAFNIVSQTIYDKYL